MIAAAVANALPNLTAALRTQITNDIRNGAESSGGSGGGGDAVPQGIHVWIERFNKLKPLAFRSAATPAEAEDWITHMEKLFQVLGCPDNFKTRLAAFKLEGDALSWWKAHLLGVQFSYMATVELKVLKEQFTGDLEEEHEQTLRDCVGDSYRRSVFAKFSKCEVWLQKSPFLGNIVLRRIIMDPSKVEAITNGRIVISSSGSGGFQIYSDASKKVWVCFDANMEGDRLRFKASLNPYESLNPHDTDSKEALKGRREMWAIDEKVVEGICARDGYDGSHSSPCSKLNIKGLVVGYSVGVPNVNEKLEGNSYLSSVLHLSLNRYWSVRVVHSTLEDMLEGRVLWYGLVVGTEYLVLGGVAYINRRDRRVMLRCIDVDLEFHVGDVYVLRLGLQGVKTFWDQGQAQFSSHGKFEIFGNVWRGFVSSGASLRSYRTLRCLHVSLLRVAYLYQPLHDGSYPLFRFQLSMSLFDGTGIHLDRQERVMEETMLFHFCLKSSLEESTQCVRLMGDRRVYAS
ncbi:hypothetical protein Tco_0271599 [Tanacetum coccineum]